MKIRSATLVGALVLSVSLPTGSTKADDDQPSYRDPSRPTQERVDDLVSRMTLAEKISQMMNAAPAISRLGIPEYEWWNEGLHGVARAGTATVFPQAIGLGATWDAELVGRVATVISTEARAKHNEFDRLGERGRYKGLTFWSPNVNIFRDPRWGRGQETYGEDPYLTARLGVAFVKGLQGDDARYLKVVATPKHFAVHSGPESDRHHFDAVVNERDLLETYLPAFQATVVEGKAASVMCAYNRTNGEPCCANTRLGETLRGAWGFQGYVVSDCGAVDDISSHHNFVGSASEASAIAVKSGTDLDCGGEYGSLAEAVTKGQITEAEIDKSLKRLMTARFRLGMFDPPEMVPYARIPYSENDSAEHRGLALEAARESLVLLKNEGGLLPLRKNLKVLAVIGPNADAPEVPLGNYNGQPSKLVTPFEGIKNKLGSGTKVIYALGSTLTGDTIAPVPASAVTVGGKGSATGFKGEYFNNKELQGEPALVRTDPQVNFDWGRGRPGLGVNEIGFSARWTGTFTPTESGTYRLGATADAGVRLFLDGQPVVDAWASNPDKTVTKELQLEAGRKYEVRLEYFHDVRGAIARFVWSYPRFTERITAEAVAAARQADVVVMVLGIAPTLEGEEMRVSVEGFKGGDRTELFVPRAQEELLEAVQAVGKPVVVVLLNGSALAVNWAAARVPAIVEAWYPGEEGGTALADVLFGDYNPAGRLPVTFYKSALQLPPFEDYAMRGRTYRYFTGEPLYPFGFGLSYSTFTYRNLRLSPTTIAAGAPVTVEGEVQNTSSRAGNEVVELYVTAAASAIPKPIRSLAGMRRIHLAPGERRAVSFTLAPEQLAVIDDKGRRVVEPGAFVISVGGKQPGFAGALDAKTTGVATGRLTVTGSVTEVR